MKGITRRLALIVGIAVLLIVVVAWVDAAGYPFYPTYCLDPSKFRK